MAPSMGAVTKVVQLGENVSAGELAKRLRGSSLLDSAWHPSIHTSMLTYVCTYIVSKGDTKSFLSNDSHTSRVSGEEWLDQNREMVNNT